MNKRCLADYRAGALAMLDEVLVYLPGPKALELKEWVEHDLAARDGDDLPPPPSRWDGVAAAAE